MRRSRQLLLTFAAWFAIAFSVVAQTVTLNLKDADISALISTVAEVTGRNFIIDPRVKGKVTVVSSRPMDSEEVYQVFLSILKVHGFAAVPSGAVIKIVPDVNAKQDGIPTVGEADTPAGDEMVTRVVQVDNIAAAQLVPILRPLVPQQGHLAAYPATNVLIISDRARNVKRLVSIIRRIDQVSDSEIEIIPLQHAAANEVVRVLTSLQRAAPTKGKTPAAAGGPVLVADERTNSVLLGGDRALRLRMRALISHLDTPMEAGGNTDVIYLKYAEATEIVDVLKGVGEVKKKEVGKGKTAAPRSQFDIQADEATNSLVITAPPDIMRTMKRVISQLDIRRAQVLVDAVIAEVSVDTSRELGMQWIISGLNDGTGPVGLINFSNTGTTITDLANAVISAKDGTQLPQQKSNATIGFGRVRSDESTNFVGLLQALSADANTNILSTPTLITLDNEEAEIIIGENVPFITGSFSSTGANSGSTNPFQTIQREDVGLTLKIKPQINEGNALKLNIEQEISSIADSVVGAADLITNKRSIKTTVMADDGSIVVLGGLIEEQVGESHQKIPLLGDIPLLGYLFRSTGTSINKTNLMVFIHPVILRDQATTERYTNSKYNYLRALQSIQEEDGIQLMTDQNHPVLPEWGNPDAIATPEITAPKKPWYDWTDE
ncbi:MAG: type II secretion system secretin GspD [Thiohalobacterales bacterium]